MIELRKQLEEVRVQLKESSAAAIAATAATAAYNLTAEAASSAKELETGKELAAKEKLLQEAVAEVAAVSSHLLQVQQEAQQAGNVPSASAQFPDDLSGLSDSHTISEPPTETAASNILSKSDTTLQKQVERMAQMLATANSRLKALGGVTVKKRGRKSQIEKVCDGSHLQRTH